jgi:hypothetical protein
MTFEEVSSLVDTLAGVAAAITLLYLTFQIRQSARHQRGNISHSRSTHVQQLMRDTAASDLFMATLLKGWAGEPLDRIQANQFYWFVCAFATLFQDTFHQHKEGMVSLRMYDSAVRTMAFQMSQPGARAAWALARGSFEPEFVAFVDDLIRRTPCAFTADVAAQWRVLVDQELTKS